MAVGKKPKKLSPHNLEVERAVLGAMVTSERARAEIISMLEPEDFYTEAHQITFLVISAMHIVGEPIDGVTLADSLKGVDKIPGDNKGLYVHTLISSCPVTTQGPHYGKLVKKLSQLRAIKRAAYDIFIRIEEERREDMDELRDWVRGRIEKAITTCEDKKIVKLSDYTEDFNRDLERRGASDGGVVGMATGFLKLDRCLSGLQKGKLYVIAARTSVGKSSFALNILSHAASNGFSCLLFSLEEDWFEIYKKITSISCEVDGRDLESGKVEIHREKIKKAQDMIGKSSIYYYKSMTASIEDIKARVREESYRHNLDLVVVDYMQLVSSRDGDNREQRVASVARGLKEVAAESGVAVVALSQFNRNVGESRKPTLSDLRESGAIEQDADVVVALSRKGDYDYIRHQCQIEAAILKNRSGPLGRFLLDFRARYTRFYNVAGSPAKPVATGRAEREAEPEQQFLETG